VAEERKYTNIPQREMVVGVQEEGRWAVEQAGLFV